MRFPPSLRVVARSLFVLGLLPRAGGAQQPLESLQAVLESRIERHAGVVGVAVLDPRTGAALSIRGDEPFPSASVIKVPILVEVFHQVENGKLRLDDPLVLLEVDKQPGSGILQYLDAPHRLTVRDAAFLMIALSDNTATNLLIDEVGIRSVGERMEALGLPRTKLHSKTFLRSTTIAPDSSSLYGLGVTTPMEMARLLAMIYHGEAVSAAASEEMVSLLRRQFYNEGIPRHLRSVEVGHKTGSLARARHDCGIVYSSARDYVLCVMTKDNADESWRLDNEAHLLIADIARSVHEALSPAAE